MHGDHTTECGVRIDRQIRCVEIERVVERGVHIEIEHRCRHEIRIQRQDAALHSEPALAPFALDRGFAEVKAHGVGGGLQGEQRSDLLVVVGVAGVVIHVQVEPPVVELLPLAAGFVQPGSEVEIKGGLLDPASG